MCRVWVHFGGVNNAFYAWLNGHLLGYSQDSCCPAEFEVTSALQPGRNVLAVQVSEVLHLASRAAQFPSQTALSGSVTATCCAPPSGVAGNSEAGSDMLRLRTCPLAMSSCVHTKTYHSLQQTQPEIVQVMRFSDGSYLEDQDHWWLSGIHRHSPSVSCRLSAKPAGLLL